MILTGTIKSIKNPNKMKFLSVFTLPQRRLRKIF